MTTGNFKYIDPASISSSREPLKKTWTKVDGPGRSFTELTIPRNVTDIRTSLEPFHTDTTGFSVHTSPATEKDFTSDMQVRSSYYAEVESILRAQLPGISRVVIFDHTIRRRERSSPRQPVQQVHVDQTPGAAEARVRRHLPATEADKLLKGRYQIINVWRPIGHAASDFPLAVVDWRSTKPEDFVPVDLLYPTRPAESKDDDDRGKEVLPTASEESTDGYEVRGETYAVRPSEGHKFYYAKDMKPDEVMFIKCFDSRSRTTTGQGSVAHCTPHTAFVDPQTPEGAKGRQSIEVRCLVFYDESGV